MSDFLSELRERRVLPALGVYVASGWVLVEILDRLVERYGLSPYLTDMVFWGLYSLLPAVALVAWSYGRPGKDTATKAQKVGVPINIVATLALLSVLYLGKSDVPADSQAAEITSADAPAIPASDAVPAAAGSRQRMAVYFFENESGDTALDWLQYAATELLTQDLQQDPYLDVVSPYSLWGNGYYQQLAARGFPAAVGAPASLLRDITRDGGRKYFVDGRITREGEDLLLETRLWDAGSMGIVLRDTRQGRDLLNMLDETSVALRTALEVPTIDQADYEDLPLAETYGESPEALEAYVSGRKARMMDSDFPAAIAAMDAALGADPTFVMALLTKGILSIQVGDVAGAAEALRRARDLDYRLPSSDRALLTANLYRSQGEADKLLDFIRLQVQLTDDARWHFQYAQLLMLKGEAEQARFHFEAALARDRYNTDIYLVLADLDRSLGDFESAIGKLRAYQELRPDDIQAEIKLGDFLRDSGDLDGAAVHYRQAELLEADTITPVLRLHYVAARQGDEARARGLLEKAMDVARTPAQLSQVHATASQFEARLGRIEPAIEQLWAAEPYMAQSQPPFVVALAIHLEVARLLLQRNDLGAAAEVMRAARERVPQPPFNGFMNAMDVAIAVREGRFDDARLSLEGFQATIDALAFDYMQFQVPMLEGELAYFQDDFGLAAERLAAGLEMIEQSFLAGEFHHVLVPEFMASLAHVQVLAGELESAELTLNRLSRLDPTAPSLWLSRARLHAARGEEEAMREALERALAVWSEADPELVDYREALALAAPGGGPGEP